MVLHEDDEHRRQCRAGGRSEGARRGGRGLRGRGGWRRRGGGGGGRGGGGGSRGRGGGGRGGGGGGGGGRRLSRGRGGGCRGCSGRRLSGRGARVSGGGRGGHRGGGWRNDRRCGRASIAAIRLATGAAGGCALPALGPRTHEHLAYASSARAPGTARGAVSEGGRSISACVRETVQLLRSTRCLAFAAGAIARVPSRLDARGADEQEDGSKQREERPDTRHGPTSPRPLLAR